MDFNAEARNTSCFSRYWYSRGLPYGLITGSLYSWKKKFEHKGEAGLKVTYDTKSKELKEENRILRKLLSDREIELEIQRELLKKSLGHPIQERFSELYL